MEVYLSELSRVRYLLRAYLRARLQKVEAHAMHILDNAGAVAVCSRKEGEWARRRWRAASAKGKAEDAAPPACNWLACASPP